MNGYLQGQSKCTESEPTLVGSIGFVPYHEVINKNDLRIITQDSTNDFIAIAPECIDDHFDVLFKSPDRLL